MIKRYINSNYLLTYLLTFLRDHRKQAAGPSNRRSVAFAVVRSDAENEIDAHDNSDISVCSVVWTKRVGSVLSVCDATRAQVCPAAREQQIAASMSCTECFPQSRNYYELTEAAAAAPRVGRKIASISVERLNLT